MFTEERLNYLCFLTDTIAKSLLKKKIFFTIKVVRSMLSGELINNIFYFHKFCPIYGICQLFKIRKIFWFFHSVLIITSKISISNFVFLFLN